MIEPGHLNFRWAFGFRMNISFSYKATSLCSRSSGYVFSSEESRTTAIEKPGKLDGLKDKQKFL
jgi:hypothetical protein